MLPQNSEDWRHIKNSLQGCVDGRREQSSNGMFWRRRIARGICSDIQTVLYKTVKKEIKHT